MVSTCPLVRPSVLPSILSFVVIKLFEHDILYNIFTITRVSLLGHTV